MGPSPKQSSRFSTRTYNYSFASIALHSLQLLENSVDTETVQGLALGLVELL